MRLGDRIGLAVIILGALWFWHEVREVHNRGEQDHAALKIGMAIKDMPWPRGNLVWAMCGNDGPTVDQTEWDSFIHGSKELPGDCHRLRFVTTGQGFEHATWSVDFDANWRISNVGPLSFTAS